MHSSWLTRHTSPGRPHRRLICFPHAGGAASFYRGWQRYAGPESELLAVQYPGRENRLREPLVPAMEQLVAALTAELSALPPLPTVLFGHSMGAAVAYETLLRLERAGTTHITRLCVSGRAPDDASRTTVRTDDEVVEAVTSLGGTNAAVFEDPDLRDLFLPIIRNDYRLIDTYRRDPDAPLLRADVHALTGSCDPRVTPEQALGWRATTAGSFALSVFEGDHFYLVPAAEQVARTVMAPATSLPVRTSLPV
ncbi:thioesterase II family protein [Streptomyces niger]|uniref:thioesterase II family protein n=1 Tax=Streptomyces niger TaxID=66373 RepID=UPI00069AA257|nr:alpha/beta fold hydrolase [Streptomyces niger]